MTIWQEEEKKFRKELAKILKRTVDGFADKTTEELETIYKEVCADFKKFLRYYRSMGGEKYLNRHLLLGLQFGVILIKRFGGIIVLDDSGNSTTEIMVKTSNGETAIEPWNIISDSFDYEDTEGNGRNIEQICIALGVSN